MVEKIRFGWSAAFYLLALAATMSGLVSKGAALALALIGTAFLFWASFHHLREWHGAKKINGRRGLDSWYFILPCLVISVIAIAGAGYGIGLRSAVPVNEPHSGSAQNQLSAATPSILVADRYYSAKNKEDIADILDRTSGAAIKLGTQLDQLAEKAINQSAWDRPGENIAPFLGRLDEINKEVTELDTKLFVDLTKDYPDFQTEVTSLLRSRDALGRFQDDAKEFQNALTIWSRSKDTSVVQDQRSDFIRLINATRINFAMARGAFVAWISELRQRVDQTRVAMRK